MGATSIYVIIFELVNIITVQAINVDNGLSLFCICFACTEVPGKLITGNW